MVIKMQKDTVLVIDCFKLVKGVGKSIGIYNLTKSIISNLAKSNIEDKKCENKESFPSSVGSNSVPSNSPLQASEITGSKCKKIIILGNEYNREDFDIPGVEFVVVNKNPLSKVTILLWELFTVVSYGKKYGATRILFPRGFRPLFCSINDTIIIHDLIPFYYHEHYPDTFNKLENRYIMTRLAGSIKHANRVITISDYSVEDIKARITKKVDHVAVIYNGVNEMGKVEPKKLEQDYMIAITSGLPHKNAVGILKTYSAYYKQAENPLKLVVIGIDSTEKYLPLEEKIKENITCIQFLKDYREVCAYIAGSKLFLFLSYAEGFGFPPIEAMQLGVPVVCSDRTSLPDVVGDAGVLVDPDDVEAVVDGINRVQNDENLRADLIAKGYKNQDRFSWESRTDLYWEELLR